MLPTDSSHLSRPGQEFSTGAADVLHIEQYGGQVEGTMAKMSFMRKYFSVKSVIGTDVVTNDRVGATTLTGVVPGVRPDATPSDFSNVSVKVDTIVLARNNVALLDDFQAHFSVRSELGKEHGKTIGKFFDEAFLIQAVKGAVLDAAVDNQAPIAGEVALPDGWEGGNSVTLGAPGDEADPDLLQKAIEDVCQSIEEKDVDLDGGVIVVRPAEFYTLLRNDRLINSQYSLGNGDYAKGMVLESCGLPLVKSNRIPSVVTGDGAGGDQTANGGNHILSNAGNGYAYNIVDADIKAKAVVLLPKALLAGETLPLTSDVYYDKKELQWSTCEVTIH